MGVTNSIASSNTSSQFLNNVENLFSLYIHNKCDATATVDQNITATDINVTKCSSAGLNNSSILFKRYSTASTLPYLLQIKSIISLTLKSILDSLAKITTSTGAVIDVKYSTQINLGTWKPRYILKDLSKPQAYDMDIKNSVKLPDEQNPYDVILNVPTIEKIEFHKYLRYLARSYADVFEVIMYKNLWYVNTATGTDDTVNNYILFEDQELLSVSEFDTTETMKQKCNNIVSSFLKYLFTTDPGTKCDNSEGDLFKLTNGKFEQSSCNLDTGNVFKLKIIDEYIGILNVDTNFKALTGLTDTSQKTPYATYIGDLKTSNSKLYDEIYGKINKLIYTDIKKRLTNVLNDYISFTGSEIYRKGAEKILDPTSSGNVRISGNTQYGEATSEAVCKFKSETNTTNENILSNDASSVTKSEGKGGLFSLVNSISMSEMNTYMKSNIVNKTEIKKVTDCMSVASVKQSINLKNINACNLTIEDNMQVAKSNASMECISESKDIIDNLNKIENIVSNVTESAAEGYDPFKSLMGLFMMAILGFAVMIGLFLFISKKVMPYMAPMAKAGLEVAAVATPQGRALKASGGMDKISSAIDDMEKIRKEEEKKESGKNAFGKSQKKSSNNFGSTNRFGSVNVNFKSNPVNNTNTTTNINEKTGMAQQMTPSPYGPPIMPSPYGPQMSPYGPPIIPHPYGPQMTPYGPQMSPYSPQMMPSEQKEEKVSTSWFPESFDDFMKKYGYKLCYFLLFVSIIAVLSIYLGVVKKEQDTNTESMLIPPNIASYNMYKYHPGIEFRKIDNTATDLVKGGSLPNFNTSCFPMITVNDPMATGGGTAGMKVTYVDKMTFPLCYKRNKDIDEKIPSSSSNDYDPLIEKDANGKISAMYVALITNDGSEYQCVKTNSCGDILYNTDGSPQTILTDTYDVTNKISTSAGSYKIRGTTKKHV